MTEADDLLTTETLSTETADGGRPKSKRELRAISSQPLRVRLVAVSVLLVTVGLVAVGALATASLRGYLYDRVDGQLTNALNQTLSRPGGGGFQGNGGGGMPPSQFYVRYADGNGEQIGFNDGNLSGSTPKIAKHALAAVNDRGLYTVASVEGSTKWRVIEAKATLTNRLTLVSTEGSILIATPLDEVQRTTSRLIRLELIVGGIVIAVLVLVSYVVVRRALKPLAEVEATAELIAAGDMTLRVKESDPRTEVGSLSRSFNTMLSQIESAFREREASEEAARTSEGRMRRFIADASHELRTPLTSIRGFAELHRQGAIRDEEGVERAMTRIEGEATRMGVLVDDLLLLARLDQQRPLELKAVDLTELVTEAVHAAQAGAPEHRITLVREPGLTISLTGDHMRLRQVVGNLLANAVAHTPAGTPVEVAVSRRGSDAVVEVRDHGPGLSPEDAARVFERFYRADASRTKATGGSGLGLSIVSALVAAHGGSVELDTEPGQGATFRVVLPLTTPDAPDTESSSNA